MRRNRTLIVLLAIVAVLALATAALAAPPEGKGKPKPPPDIWTCAARVDNGAVWVPGKLDGTSYKSDYPQMEFKVDIPLCIDMAAHKDVAGWWTVSWTGETVRKDPKGLMFIFEEELPGTHYGELEVLPAAGDITSGTVEIEVVGNGNAKHLVFLAMGRQGDKWKNIEFTVTPPS